MAVTWDSIKEGDALPTIKKTPGVTQLVKYAAGGGDFPRPEGRAWVR